MNLWLDTETFCPVPLNHGNHSYAEEAEVMLLAWAPDDAPVQCWDVTNGTDAPDELVHLLEQTECLVWFQNGEKFDWPVLDHAQPWISRAVPLERRRDTMVQAYSHSLPGGLEMMADALGVDVDKRKLKIGRKLMNLFCKPQKDGTRATRLTNPEDWEDFKAYAIQDIVAMRECHRRMPTWNYKGKQLALSRLDQRINARGMCMDIELAVAAVEASEISKKQLAKRTQEMTGNAVQAATQRDVLLAHILEHYGVTLPDMQGDTLERRIRDENLPTELRELLAVRLESVTTSVAKFSTLLRGVNRDGRLRGCMQFRGASRTGRVGHRLFQPGNMPRPTMTPEEIEWAIELLKLRAAHLVYENVMKVCSNAIRGTIIADEGKKMVVADLKNIEGRFAAWLAHEEWKLQAYRDYDAGIGPDLYVLAYANSFNVDPDTVGKGDKRQIGKVQELMFQYGGGVGAWITGAATYGIDLAQMTEQVWDTLPDAEREEARGFLDWLYEEAEARYAGELKRTGDQFDSLLISIEDVNAITEKAVVKREAAKLKARLGLEEKTFICCDAIKRLWRKAHPEISSYWKELEHVICSAIGNPGETFTARRLKIRRDGAWLRIALPSGRALCYPQPAWDLVIGKKHWPGFSYMGIDQYTKQWKRISSYGGKVFENVTQAGACDVLLESGDPIEAAGFELVLSVHDEWTAEAPIDRDDLNEELLGELMCAPNEWNAGLPLAAAGYSAQRYKKDF